MTISISVMESMGYTAVDAHEPGAGFGNKQYFMPKQTSAALQIALRMCC